MSRLTRVLVEPAHTTAAPASSSTQNWYSVHGVSPLQQSSGASQFVLQTIHRRAFSWLKTPTSTFTFKMLCLMGMQVDMNVMET